VGCSASGVEQGGWGWCWGVGPAKGSWAARERAPALAPLPAPHRLLLTWRSAALSCGLMGPGGALGAQQRPRPVPGLRHDLQLVACDLRLDSASTRPLLEEKEASDRTLRGSVRLSR